MKFELNMMQIYLICLMWQIKFLIKFSTDNCLLIVYKFISISFSVLITRIKKPNTLCVGYLCGYNFVSFVLMSC